VRVSRVFISAYIATELRNSPFENFDMSPLSPMNKMLRLRQKEILSVDEPTLQTCMGGIQE
jgi:hypothetical protein